MFLTLYNSFHNQLFLIELSYSNISSFLSMFSNIDCAAIMPDFIARWVPLIFGTLRKPASHPVNIPPGKVNFGKDCIPPSFNALAP